MNARRLETHRTRLKRAILLTSVIPAFLVAICAFVYATKNIDVEHRATGASEIANAAQRYKTLADREIKSALLALEFLDRFPRDHEPSAEELRKMFSALSGAMPWIDGLAILDGQGRPLAGAGQPMPPNLPSPAGRPGDANGSLPAAITDVRAEPGGTPHFFIDIAAGPGGPPATIRLTANAFLFSALLDRERIGRTGEVFLINGEGILQTGSVLHGGILDRVDATLAGGAPQADGVLKREWEGATLWYTILPLDNVPGWRLVVQRDEKEILEGRDAVVARSALLALLFLAVLAAAAFRCFKNILAVQDSMQEEEGRLRDWEMHIQKLDAISQLGVGIAHEVNNPLAIIGEEAGWMQDVLRRESFKDIPDAGELRDSLRQIVTQTARSREITHKLLSFGGKTDGTIRDVEMNILVTDVVVLRRREASQKNIEIREELAEKLSIILSEPALLRQLLINLINNSMDAMPNGGRITISTTQAKDGGVRLQVHDTGFGIPRENLDKIFDPFFTTKPPGKGAGLGLSISHGILQRIGGRISVDSTPGHGTTVTVELPLEARPWAG